MKQYIKQRILRVFGNKVKQIRVCKGWSQEDLAVKAGLHRTYIGSIERNERNVSLINVERIANALDISAQLLIDGKKPLRETGKDTNGALGQGAHASSIYKDREEQFAVLMPFLIAGLKRREKCLCIVEEDTRDLIAEKLRKRGLSVDKCSQWGQFLFLPIEEVYLKNGNFSYENVVEAFKNRHQDALSEGFYGLRVAGEISKRVIDRIGQEKFIEYESRLNYFFPGTKVTALCQYDEAVFDKKFLLNSAVLTHPKLFLHGKLTDNTYYKAPNIVVKSHERRSSDCEYERIKAELLEKATDQA